MNSLVCLLLASAETNPPDLFETIIGSNVINVILVFTFLTFIIRKYNLLGGLDNSQKKIIEDLRKAEKTKEDSINQLKEAEEKLKNAKQEADRIIHEAEKFALIQQEDIINKAQQEAERIIQQAQKAIMNEQEQAINDLRQKLTKAAVEVAKDNIVIAMDENWQKKLIHDFVEDLSHAKVK